MAIVGNEAPGARVAARGTVQLLIGRAGFMLGGYAIAVILARGLGPVAYGTYGLLMSMLVWLEVSGDLGVQRATIKLIPESSDQQAMAQTSAALMLTLSLMLFTVCWFAAPAVAAAFEIPDGTRLFRIAIIDIPFNGVYLAHQGILYGYRRFGTLSLVLILYSAAKLTGIASLLWLGISIEAALIANVLATVVALIYLFSRSRIKIAFPDRGLVRSIIRVALPLGVSIMTTQLLLSAHLWSLKRLSEGSAEMIGYYVAALNLARLPSAVPFVLTGIVLASISSALAKQNKALAHRYIQAAGRFILVVLAPVCALGAIDATPIMEFVYSEAYASGGKVFALLLAAFCLYALLDTLIHAMIAAGKYYEVSAAQLALLPVALGLNWLLIPEYGAPGAATAFLVTVIVGAAAALVWTCWRFGTPAEPATIIRVALSTFLVVILSSGWQVYGIWLLLKLSLLMAVYGLVLILLRELGPADLKPLAVWKKP